MIYVRLYTRSVCLDNKSPWPRARLINGQLTSDIRLETWFITAEEVLFG